MNTTENIITRLETLISEECTKIDREAAFAASLDESGPVNVCGLQFNPSQIWKELDPTAFRCGVNDFADGEDWSEVDGETYATSDCEEQKDNLVSELEDDLQALEENLEDLQNGEEDESQMQDLKAEIATLTAQLAQLNKHGF